jgi:hypothetical protein
MAGLVLLSTCASAAVAADASQPSKSAPSQAAPSSSGKPVITPKPDGTFSIHNEPRNGASKTAKAKGGLVIPPQIVTPIFSAPEKK